MLANAATFDAHPLVTNDMHMSCGVNAAAGFARKPDAEKEAR